MGTVRRCVSDGDRREGGHGSIQMAVDHRRTRATPPPQTKVITVGKIWCAIFGTHSFAPLPPPPPFPLFYYIPEWRGGEALYDETELLYGEHGRRLPANRRRFNCHPSAVPG